MASRNHPSIWVKENRLFVGTVSRGDRLPLINATELLATRDPFRVSRAFPS
jgi:hypothetical protein